MNQQIEKYLLSVQKPAAYTGGEAGSVMKDKSAVDVRFAFCFPDTYEIGMSHLGMKILYGLINTRPDAWCERVFAPRDDIEKVLRDNQIPLYALESGDPLGEFDIIGFTLMYELCYTNVLNMLDLAGIPVRAKDRPSLSPLVVAGGPCACNAEPMAAFIDLFMLGDGEDVMMELLDLYKEWKRKGGDKASFLEAASHIEGIYVPSLYDVSYHEDGTVEKITPLKTAPAVVNKRNVSDLEHVYYPDNFVVPFTETVFDRAVHEIFRGCIRGCRFCQAGFIYRPIREKSPETISRQSLQLCENTGYDELSLCSLSSSDYSQIQPLLNQLLSWADPRKINIALPSLRIDNFDEELLEKLSSIRKSGLTFAAEAGTQRLRDVINKNISEEEILTTARKAFSGGRTAVKLYFMLGLPTETQQDVAGIADLAQKVVDTFYHNPNKPKGKSVQVSVSASPPTLCRSPLRLSSGKRRTPKSSCGKNRRICAPALPQEKFPSAATIRMSVFWRGYWRGETEDFAMSLKPPGAAAAFLTVGRIISNRKPGGRRSATGGFPRPVMQIASAIMKRFCPGIT